MKQKEIRMDRDGRSYRDQQEYAFPSEIDGTAYTWLTRRDWLAGMALSGLSAINVSHNGAENLAKMCYERADALIKEGNR